MNIVLQRSSPEQRQIEMLTILQLYLDSIKELLKTERFMSRSFENSFEISEDDDDSLTCIDVNALNSTILNISHLLCEEASQNQICNTILEANFIPILVEIPYKIKEWQIDLQSLDATIITTLTLLSRTSNNFNQVLSSCDYSKNLFDGLKSHGKPSTKLISECLNLFYNNETNLIVNGNVLIGLIQWINEMNENEQIFLAENLLKIFSKNLLCKAIACQYKSIDFICKSISDYHSLTSKCVIDLIKCIEELGKHNIHPIELKNLLTLLRADFEFEFRKQLLLVRNSI